MLDDTSARGITRRLTRLIDRSSGKPRAQAFAFGRDLLSLCMDGKKVDASTFNVKLSALLASVAGNSTTLAIKSNRLKLGTAGTYRRLAIETQEIGHFRNLSPDYTQEEWAVTVDDVRVAGGAVSACYWTIPILFDPHFVRRRLQRSRFAVTVEEAVELVGTTLPLAILVRDAATMGKFLFAPWDVILPTPEGVLCGGIELVNCEAFSYKIQMGRMGQGWQAEVDVMPLSLHMAVCVRTFLHNDSLSSGQSDAAAALHRWLLGNKGRIEAEPVRALGWSDELTPDRASLIDEFRQIYPEVLAQFRSWRTEVISDGYVKINWADLAQQYQIPEWKNRALAADTIGRYLKSPNIRV